mmetsp:Transcript_24101/g.42578  ORF Transcript_24101/g.42578 Transcript_24101/m.42578 type:complete len:269 (-) Transcript_24101:74-880(-)
MGAGYSLSAVVRDGFGIQVIAWAVAAALQTEKFYDMVGTSTFAFLSLRSFLSKKNPLTRNYVNTGIIVSWAARLGSFLVDRVHRDGGDRRFDQVKTKPAKFLFYWLMQGLWCVATGLPVYLINTKSENPEGSEEITARDIAGWSLWLAGFVLQVTADRQKRIFRKENPGMFITTGVWAWSQHPNYFGEMLMWGSLWLSSSAQMTGVELATVLCPMFNFILLRYVSGVPILQYHAKKRWGDNPLFQAYMAQTNLLFPNPFASPVRVKKE